MKKKNIFRVLVATLWISGSEFFRNEILLKSYWANHYAGLGMTFPSEPINGAMWGLWSLMLAISISVLIQRFTLLKSILLAWFMGFAMMWVVIGNMGVLPLGILVYAIPLSLLEVSVAGFILKKN